MARVTVEWVRDGTIQWEAWWVRRHGYTRNPDPPGRQAHIGFANEDLRRNGLPLLRTTPDGALYADVSDGRMADFRSVIEYHGFQIERVS